MQIECMQIEAIPAENIGFGSLQLTQLLDVGSTSNLNGLSREELLEDEMKDVCSAFKLFVEFDVNFPSLNIGFVALPANSSTFDRKQLPALFKCLVRSLVKIYNVDNKQAAKFESELLEDVSEVTSDDDYDYLTFSKLAVGTIPDDMKCLVRNKLRSKQNVWKIAKRLNCAGVVSCRMKDLESVQPAELQLDKSAETLDISNLIQWSNLPQEESVVLNEVFLTIGLVELQQLPSCNDSISEKPSTRITLDNFVGCLHDELDVVQKFFLTASEKSLEEAATTLTSGMQAVLRIAESVKKLTNCQCVSLCCGEGMPHAICMRLAHFSPPKTKISESVLETIKVRVREAVNAFLSAECVCARVAVVDKLYFRALFDCCSSDSCAEVCQHAINENAFMFPTCRMLYAQFGHRINYSQLCDATRTEQLILKVRFLIEQPVESNVLQLLANPADYAMEANREYRENAGSCSSSSD